MIAYDLIYFLFFNTNYKSKLRIFVKVKKNLLIFAAEATAIKEATTRNLMVWPDYAIQDYTEEIKISKFYRDVCKCPQNNNIFLTKEGTNLHLLFE